MMPKVWCAETECEYYGEDGCTANEINITAGHIHAKHQGYIHHWECRTFKMSEEYKKLFGMLKAYFDRVDKEDDDAGY